MQKKGLSTNIANKRLLSSMDSIYCCSVCFKVKAAKQISRENNVNKLMESQGKFLGESFSTFYLCHKGMVVLRSVLVGDDDGCRLLLFL